MDLPHFEEQRASLLTALERQAKESNLGNAAAVYLTASTYKHFCVDINYIDPTKELPVSKGQDGMAATDFDFENCTISQLARKDFLRTCVLVLSQVIEKARRRQLPDGNHLVLNREELNEA